MENIYENYQSIYSDKEMQYAIVGIMLLPLYIKLTSQLSVIISFPTIITTVIYYGGIWFLILKYIVKNIKTFVINAFQLVVLVSIFCVFCYVMGSTGTKYIFNNSIQELVLFQPSSLFFTSLYMLLGISIQDFDSFCEKIHKFSKVGIVFGALIYILGLFSGNLLYYDDMNYAYSLSLMVCCLIACYTQNDIAFVIIGVVCLLLAGTRGPLVCVVAAFLLKTFIGEKDMRKVLSRIVICVLAVVILYSGLLEWILQKMMGALSGFGVTQLRILDYMSNGMLMDSSGRDGFSQVIVDAIKEKPFLGYGIGADRTLLSKGRYCHNIILEILVSVGMVLGTVLIIWMAVRVIKMLSSGDESYKIIAMAFLSGEIVKLLFSLSILQSNILFIFLGMSMVTTGRIKWKSPICEGEVTEYAE